MVELIYLHLFTELFHEDLSSIVRTNMASTVFCVSSFVGTWIFFPPHNVLTAMFHPAQYNKQLEQTRESI